MLGSTRRNGNSEQLARRAARELPASDEQRWVSLSDYPLPAFVDTRHDVGYGDPDGNARVLAEATLAATDLVIVSPVYWYSLSWTVKLYLDHWSAWMRSPALAFKATLAHRSLWSIVVDSDDEAAGSAGPAIDTLRRTADYMKMHWRGALIGHANRPGDIEQDAAALTAAREFFAAARE